MSGSRSLDCGGKAAAFGLRKAAAVAAAVRNLLVIALFLAACGQREHDQQLAREAALKQQLAQFRSAIAAFRAQHQRYPASLEELTPKIPVDPITGVADWRVITEETVAVSSDFTTAAAPKPVVSLLDVKSKAPGNGSDGKPYSEY